MQKLWRVALVVLMATFCAALPANAGPGNTKKTNREKRQVLIYAHRVDGRVEFVCEGRRYSAKELDYAMGEWHIDAAKDSEVAVVLEDNMTLSDVKEVPAMALKTGFTEVRTFVYWKETGNVAEVFFGPVMRYRRDEPIN
jgi:hypothetical protein